MCFDGTNRARKCLNSPSFLESIFGPYFDKDEEIDLCDDSTLDAIFIQEDGSIYAFRGRHDLVRLSKIQQNNVKSCSKLEIFVFCF